MTNPYTDPIYTKVEGGKMIQVPRYIQHEAVLKWDVLRNNARPIKQEVNRTGSHTRLDRRDRYSGVDPYIIDKELQGAADDMNEFEDYPEGNELYKLRQHERSNRRYPEEDEQIHGVDSDIKAEVQNAETHSEQYASLDDAENQRNQQTEISDAYDTGCTTCPKSPILYRGQDRHVITQQRERERERQRQRPDDEEDEDMDPTDIDMVENRDDNTDNTYKYLFFIVLFIAIAVFIYHRNKFGF
jgi:hypothetical protein